MSNRDKYLAICDKPSQIMQLIAFEKMQSGVKFVNFGENLLVVVLDSLGNNHTAYESIRKELDANYLFNASLIKYESNEEIYSGDYTKPDGLRVITAFIRSKLNTNVQAIFCALLSQRFVKIHLDAYPKAPIYLLEDGLASYLEIPVKDCSAWGMYYSHTGIVKAHLSRIQKSILSQPELGIPKCYLQAQKFNVDFVNNVIQEEGASEDIFLCQDSNKRKFILDAMLEHWRSKANTISLPAGCDVVVIGQNLSDFCKNFFFRNEVEMYVSICEKLLKKFEKIVFVPHPKASERMTSVMKMLLNNPDRVYFFNHADVPVESLFLLPNNSPKYAVGFYSSSMWNLSQVVGLKSVYTALGWETQKFFQELAHDIQKQAYKKARQEFYHFNRLLNDME